MRVERLSQIRASVDPDEVAGAGVHRQPCLYGEVAVVPLDQLVHPGEAPVFGELAPCCGERRGILDLLGERSPALAELMLVLVDGVLDGAKPAHPGGGAAEG